MSEQDPQTAAQAHWDSAEHMFRMAQVERAICAAGADPETARRIVAELEPGFRQVHVALVEEKMKSAVEGIRIAEGYLRELSGKVDGTSRRIIGTLANEIGGLAGDFETEMGPEIARLKASVGL